MEQNAVRWLALIYIHTVLVWTLFENCFADIKLLNESSELKHMLKCAHARSPLYPSCWPYQKWQTLPLLNEKMLEVEKNQLFWPNSGTPMIFCLSCSFAVHSNCLTQHGFQNFSLQNSKLTKGQTKMMSLVPLPLLYFLVKVATGYSLSEKRVWCAHRNSVYNNSTDPNGCARKVTSGCVIVGTSKLTAINMRHWTVVKVLP